MKKSMFAELVPHEIIKAFCNTLSRCTVTPLGLGNINDTFLVDSGSSSFVLQRINGEVFPHPQLVAENFQCINRHLSSQKCTEGEELLVAAPVLTLDKKLFVLDDLGSIWRGQSYLAHKNISALNNADQAHQMGRILALFHRRLIGLDGTVLPDPLPGFHHLPGYLTDYDEVAVARCATVDHLSPENRQMNYCLAIIERYRGHGTCLEDAKNAGFLRLQPIHGDPKVDNFLFGEDGQAVGLLDLDTVAMGLVHNDLGDCLRSCCNTLGEEGEVGQEQQVHFDLDFCQALLEGYFSRPGSLLSADQCDYIFDGLLLICYELGLRFFTDHLRGNRYFKVERDGDNLLRAGRQFQLTEDVAVKEKQIRAMVKAARS